MAFEDHIIKDQKYEYEGVFNFNEIIDLIKDWFERDRYKYNRKEKFVLETKKINKIKFEFDRKVDDYHRFVIKVGIDVKKDEIVKGKVKGKFKLKINSIIKRDYGDEWSDKPWKVFIRNFVDRFIQSEKEDKMTKKLESETNSMLNAVKRYFKGK